MRFIGLILVAGGSGILLVLVPRMGLGKAGPPEGGSIVEKGGIVTRILT
jgi:hypothetical protein